MTGKRRGGPWWPTAAAMGALAVVGAALLIIPPNLAPSPKSSSQASAPSASSETWPTQIRIAVPADREVPAAEAETFLTELERDIEEAGRLRISGQAVSASLVPLSLDATIEALQNGEVEVAILDAHWLRKARRETGARIGQYFALEEGKPFEVAAWIVREGALDCEVGATTAGVAWCAGTEPGSPLDLAQPPILAKLDGERIALGADDDGLLSDAPGDQLGASGMTDTVTISRAPDPLRALCDGTADAAVARIGDLAACADGTAIQVIALTPPVPIAGFAFGPNLSQEVRDELARAMAAHATCASDEVPAECAPLLSILWGVSRFEYQESVGIFGAFL